MEIDSSVRALIAEKLAAIEVEEQCVILYACESGSRAWGFASPDSDYDVRFVYVRPVEQYPCVDLPRDVIERGTDERNIDCSGWDLRKALGLFRKSNPPLLEWLQSPIVYADRLEFGARMRALMKMHHSPAACLHHYLHMARGNFRGYLQGPEVRRKKYLYVLRPVLGCMWIEREWGPVPMEFGVLVEQLLPSGPVRSAIDQLLKDKMSSGEMGAAPRDPVLHEFLESEIERLNDVHLAERPRAESSELDCLFREVVREAAALKETIG